MKLTLTREALKEAVAGLSRVVPRKTHLPILAAVRIEAGPKQVRFTATNLDQYASYTAEAATQKPGVALVDLEQLKPFTKGAAADVLALESTREHLHITNPVHGQAINHTLPLHDPADWPATPPKVETSEVPAEFLDALHRVTPFASTDSSRAVLCGVCVDVSEPKRPTLVATDGRRLTAVEVPGLGLASSVVLPACRILERFTGTSRIGVHPTKAGTWLKLELPSWEVWLKAVEGDYPRWRHVVPGGEMPHAFTLGEAAVAFLGKALPAFPGHEDPHSAIRLIGMAGEVFLEGRSREAKEATRVILPDAVCIGGDAQVAVNRAYLREALDAGFRTFSMADELSPLVARDGKSGIHVLMPMRVDAISPPPPKPATVPAPVKEPPRVAIQVTTPVAPPVAEPMKEKPMPEKKPAEPNALDRLLAAYEATKAKVREANDALGALAGALKDAVREDRVRRSEIDTVRAGLERLKAIRV